MQQKTYSGKGIFNMLSCCYKNNLYSWNSELHIKDPKDLDSEWVIVVPVRTLRQKLHAYNKYLESLKKDVK